MTARHTFPRTTQDAFNDADRAESITGPFRDPNGPIWWVLAVVLLAVLAYAGLTLPDGVLS